MKKITAGLIALMLLLTTATACTSKPSENESSAASSDISNVISDISSASSEESSNTSSDISSDVSSDVSSDISDTSSGNTYIPPVDDEPEFVDVTSISFESAEINIPLGTMMPIVVNVGPEDATNKDYILTSSDESILTVMLTNVMGLDNGTVTLTVTSVSNPEIFATCTVIVGEGSGTEKDDESDTPSDPPSHTCSFSATKTVEPTCETKGYTLYTCSCGESEKRNEAPALGHLFDIENSEVIKEPTSTSTGIRRYYCTRNNCDEYKDEAMPMIENDDNDDENNNDDDKYNVPDTKDNIELLEERILHYINEYRAKDGVAPVTALLNGKTYQYAKMRAEQIVYDFSHNTEDIRYINNMLEFGVYHPSTPEWSYDAVTGEFYETGNMTEPYYSGGCSEALTKGYGSYGTIDDVARGVASSLYNSSAHWSYVGADTTVYITIGAYVVWDEWYICVATSTTDQYD